MDYSVIEYEARARLHDRLCDAPPPWGPALLLLALAGLLALLLGLPQLALSWV